MAQKQIDGSGGEKPYDIPLEFENRDNLVAFCDLMGVSADAEVIRGEDALRLFEWNASCV